MTDARYSPDAWDDSESSHGSESWAEVEAMIGAAASYVQPSDDLRPRVLEAAQRHVGERHLFSGLRRLALITLVASMLTTLMTPARVPLELPRQSQVGAAQFGSVIGVDEPSFDLGTRDIDRQPLSGWPLDRWHDVDAFTGTRRRQAEVLRFVPTASGRPGA